MSTVNSANAAAKKGMTPLNKVLAIIAVAMAAITAIFGALAGLRFYQARQMNTEAERVTAQATSIRVSSWCAKVTPDSIPPSMRSTGSTVRSSKRCATRSTPNAPGASTPPT